MMLIVKPDSHLLVWVIEVVKKDPKDEDSQSNSFILWVFLHDSNYSKGLE